MKKALIAGLAVGLGSAASAQMQTSGPQGPLPYSYLLNRPAGPTLWEQLPDGSGNFVDQNFETAFDAYDAFMVMDVSFGGNVNITDITTYYTAGNWPLGAGTATLNIFANDGSGLPAPGDFPGNGSSVATNAVAFGAGQAITASGLNLNLAPGNYWVGLTPEISFGNFGQQFHEAAAPDGGPDHSASRNFNGGFGFGPDWFASSTRGSVTDGAITILGTPTPGTLALLGLGGLVASRRRR